MAFSSREGANPPQLVISYGRCRRRLAADAGVARPRAEPLLHDGAVLGDQPGDPRLRPRGFGVRAPGRRPVALRRQRRPRVRGGRHREHRAAGAPADASSPTPSRRVASGARPASPGRTTSSRIAYDATNDVLYQFSGNCCSSTPGTTQPPYDPTIYRLKRDSARPVPGRVVPAAARGHRPDRCRLAARCGPVLRPRWRRHQLRLRHQHARYPGHGRRARSRAASPV